MLKRVCFYFLKFLLIWTWNNAWDSLVLELLIRSYRLFSNSFKLSPQKHILLKNIYLLIMLLELSHFRPFTPLHPAHPVPPTFPSYNSCPRVIHISSLASTFPKLFLPSPCLFSTYHLCYLFSVPFPTLSPPTPLLITLHVISISVVLFLF